MRGTMLVLMLSILIAGCLSPATKMEPATKQHAQERLASLPGTGDAITSSSKKTHIETIYNYSGTIVGTSAFVVNNASGPLGASRVDHFRVPPRTLNVTGGGSFSGLGYFDVEIRDVNGTTVAPPFGGVMVSPAGPGVFIELKNEDGEPLTPGDYSFLYHVTGVATLTTTLDAVVAD